MTIKKESHLWKKGSTGNPNGRPKAPGKPVSPLRKTLSKLMDMEEQAIINIRAIINGVMVEDENGKEVKVDKDRQETSKWVISTISSMSRAATQDEQLRHDIRSRAEDKAERSVENDSQKEGSTGNVVRGRFTTEFVEDKE